VFLPLLTPSLPLPFLIGRYPKANTGGCTNQAQAYRDEYSSWKDLGYSVYGLSSDNVTPLKNWKEVRRCGPGSRCVQRRGLPRLHPDRCFSLFSVWQKYSFEYKLLSDPQRSLIGPLTGTKSKTIRR
jgi:peroxiredoxin Q/BCP